MAAQDLLSSRFQEAAVQQAARHGFTYWRPLAERFHMDRNAANGVFGALCYKRILNSFPLFGNTNGFRLTPLACQLFDFRRMVARQRGEQAWIFRLARLVDCERRGVEPLTPEVMQTDYPELSEFLDMADRFVPGCRMDLTVLHVDHGGNADRIVAKTNAIASRFLKNAAARQLIWRGQLGIRVITASTGKAEAIEQRLARATNEPLARLEIDVVEDLVHLLARKV